MGISKFLADFKESKKTVTYADQQPQHDDPPEDSQPLDDAFFYTEEEQKKAAEPPPPPPVESKSAQPDDNQDSQQLDWDHMDVDNSDAKDNKSDKPEPTSNAIVVADKNQEEPAAEHAPVFNKLGTVEKTVAAYIGAHQVDMFIIPPEDKLSVKYVGDKLYVSAKTWKDFGLHKPIVKIVNHDSSLKGYEVAFQGIPLKYAPDVDTPQERLRMEHVCWLLAPKKDANRSESYVACAYVNTGKTTSDCVFAKIPLEKLKELYSFMNDIDIAMACNNMINVKSANYLSVKRVPFIPHDIYLEKCNNRTRSGGKLDIEVAKSKNEANEKKQLEADKKKDEEALVPGPLYNVPTLRKDMDDKPSKKLGMPANRVARNINLCLHNTKDDIDFENDKEISKIAPEELGHLMQPTTVDKDLFGRQKNLPDSAFIVGDDEEIDELLGRKVRFEERIEKTIDKTSKDYLGLLESLDSIKLKIDQMKDKNKRKIAALGGRRLKEIKEAIEYAEKQSIVSSFMGSRCSWGKYTYAGIMSKKMQFLDMDELRNVSCISSINYANNDEKDPDVENISMSINEYVQTSKIEDADKDAQIVLDWVALDKLALASSQPPEPQESSDSKALVVKKKESGASAKKGEKKKEVEDIKNDVNELLDNNLLMEEYSMKRHRIGQELDNIEKELEAHHQEIEKTSAKMKRFQGVLAETIHRVQELTDNKTKLETLKHHLIDTRAILIKGENETNAQAQKAHSNIKERTAGADNALSKVVRQTIDKAEKEKQEYDKDKKEKMAAAKAAANLPLMRRSPGNHADIVKKYKDGVAKVRETFDPDHVNFVITEIRKFVADVAKKAAGLEVKAGELKELRYLEKLVKERNEKVLEAKKIPIAKLRKRVPEWTPQEEMLVNAYSLLFKFENNRKNDMLANFMKAKNNETLKFAATFFVLYTYAANYFLVYDPKFLEITESRIGDRSNYYDLMRDFATSEECRTKFKLDTQDLLSWLTPENIEREEKYANRLYDLQLVVATVFYKHKQIIDNKNARQVKHTANVPAEGTKSHAEKKRDAVMASHQNKRARVEEDDQDQDQDDDDQQDDMQYDQDDDDDANVSNGYDDDDNDSLPSPPAKTKQVTPKKHVTPAKKAPAPKSKSRAKPAPKLLKMDEDDDDDDNDDDHGDDDLY
jgi:hypothetical protein